MGHSHSPVPPSWKVERGSSPGEGPGKDKGHQGHQPTSEAWSEVWGSWAHASGGQGLHPTRRGSLRSHVACPSEDAPELSPPPLAWYFIHAQVLSEPLEQQA